MEKLNGIWKVIIKFVIERKKEKTKSNLKTVFLFKTENIIVLVIKNLC